MTAMPKILPEQAVSDGSLYDLDRVLWAEGRAADLRARYHGLTGQALLEPLIKWEFPGQIAQVSSFGTEAAVLLALVAEVDPSVPVVFLETGKHFGETLRYRDKLIAQLGLTDVRSVTPDAAEVAERDPDGMLFQRAPDACCYIRKVAPLHKALKPFDAWITGRKRFQGGMRVDLRAIESVAGQVKVNPLVEYTPDDIQAAFEKRGLPHHPLEAEGYLSIGCMPCTERTPEDGDARAGRWSGKDKIECGIHTAVPAE